MKPSERPKFPIVRGARRLAGNCGKCIVCGKKILLGEPNSFAGINGCGWLGLYWHGAHTDFGAKGINPDIGAHVDIAYNISGGETDSCMDNQFEIVVCTTDCLRKLFSKAVDSLETRMTSAKREREKLLKSQHNKGVVRTARRSRARLPKR